jgi:hypothetical protein
MGSFDPEPEQLFRTAKGPDPTKKTPRWAGFSGWGDGCVLSQLYYAGVPVFEQFV